MPLELAIGATHQQCVAVFGFESWPRCGVSIPAVKVIWPGLSAVSRTTMTWSTGLEKNFAREFHAAAGVADAGDGGVEIQIPAVILTGVFVGKSSHKSPSVSYGICRSGLAIIF